MRLFCIKAPKFMLLLALWQGAYSEEILPFRQTAVALDPTHDSFFRDPRIEETLHPSYHHCVSMRLPKNSPAYFREHVFRRCQLLNICSHGGKFLYFHSANPSQQAPSSLEFDGFPVSMHTENGEQTMSMLDSRNNFQFVTRVIEQSEISTWIAAQGIARVVHHRNPALLISKHGCFHAGHCIMENLLPLAMNLKAWEESHCAKAGCDVFNNTIIQVETTHDDGNDCGCFSSKFCGHGRDCGPCGDDNSPQRRLSCAYFVEQILGAVGRRPPIYLNQLQSFNLTSATMECWDRAYVGTGPYGPFTEPFQRESHGYLNTILRQMMHARYSLPPIVPAGWHKAFCQSLEINVMFHEKLGKRRITNIRKVLAWTRNHVNAVKINDADIRFKTSILRWDDLQGGFKKQLELLNEIDILITSAGGATANAIFLRDGAALLTSQLCQFKRQPLSCDFFDGPALYEHLPHVGLFIYTTDSIDELSASSGSSIHFDVTFRKVKFLAVLDKASWFVLNKAAGGHRNMKSFCHGVADTESTSFTPAAASPSQPYHHEGDTVNLNLTSDDTHSSRRGADRLDQSNATKAQSLSEISETFVSYHQCVSAGSGYSMRRCQFTNICSNRGKFVYFESSNKSQHATAFYDQYGHSHSISEIHPEPISKVGSHDAFTFAPDIVLSTNSKAWLAQNEIKHITWHKAPALLIRKYHCGNRGHCATENLFPMAMHLLMWEKSFCAMTGCDVFNNMVIQMEMTSDNGKDCGCKSNVEACKGANGANSKDRCPQFVEQILGALSHDPPAYLNQLPSFDPNSAVMECWDRAYVGTGPFSPMIDGSQRESHGLLYGMLRDMVYLRLSLRQPVLTLQGRSPGTAFDLNVLIHVTEGWNTIANIDEVADWTKKHTMLVGDSLPFSRAIPASRFSFNASLVHLDKLRGGMKQQMELLSMTHIFITSAGDSAVLSIFLPDGASIITTQTCFNPEPPCEDIDGSVVLEHLPYVGFFLYIVESEAELTPSKGLSTHFDISFDYGRYIPILEKAAWFVLFKVMGRSIPPHPSLHTPAETSSSHQKEVAAEFARTEIFPDPILLKKYRTTVQCADKCCRFPDSNRTCKYQNLYFYNGSFFAFAIASEIDLFQTEHTEVLRCARSPELERPGSRNWVFTHHFDENVFMPNLKTFESQAEMYNFISLSQPLTYDGLYFLLGLCHNSQAIHSNLGHALMDDLYSAWYGLLKFALDQELFAFLVYDAFSGYTQNHEIFSQFSGRPIQGWGSWPSDVWIRLETVVVGVGNTGLNAVSQDYKMSGLRWDALRSFRTRMLKAYNLHLPPHRNASNQDRITNSPLKVTLIPNKRDYGNLHEHARIAVELCPGLVTTHVMDFRDAFLWEDQLRIFSETDVYVSGIGTGFVGSFLIPDGGVVINVGAHQVAYTVAEAQYYRSNGYPPSGVVHFQDEYLSRSAGYLRTLYVDPKVRRNGISSKYLATMICDAATIIRKGFSLPVAAADNSSPFGNAAAVLFQEMPDLWVVKATGLNLVTGEHKYECWGRAEGLLCDAGWFERCIPK